MGVADAGSTQQSPRECDLPAAEIAGHTLAFGSDQADLDRLAVEALAAGARRGEKLLFVAEEVDAGRLGGLANIDRLIDSRQLELLAADDVYAEGAEAHATDLRDVFQRLLDDAVWAGYRGLRVVADNTRWVSADEQAFRRWLTWEQVSDRFQAGAPVTGVCYFDRTRVADDRRVVLAALHPAGGDGAEPPFRFTAGPDGTTLLTGQLDLFGRDAFARVVAAAPADAPLVVDLSQVEFLDHRALLVLARAASPARPVRLRHAAPIHRRLVRMLGESAARLILET